MIRIRRNKLLIASGLVLALLLSNAVMFSRGADAPGAAPATRPEAAAAAPSSAALMIYPESAQLESKSDDQSFVVQFTRPDGVTRDVTEEAKFALANPALARIDGHVLRPIADGATQLNVSYEGHTLSMPVTVSGAAAQRPISFKLDVMPVFMRAGCNSGSCHGSSRGKDGFRLSLFGYDAEGDYQRITRELATRRINLALPAESLMIQKALGKVRHTGGTRFAEGSPYHATLMRWLEAGAPQDAADVARPVSLELLPGSAVLEGEGTTQKLVARARYSDGADRDVTHLALFLTSNDNSAKVSPDGLITAGRRGEAFVMARFATFTVGTHVIVVPPGSAPPFPTEPETNYVDKLVNDKLRKLRVPPSDLCTDEQFIRRASLDVIGLLPTPEQRERFVASADAAKREKLIDELLARPEFVEMWVMKFAELLKIRSTGTVSYKATVLYYNWLKDRLARNVPMDQIVRELVSATGGTFKNPAANYYAAEVDTLKLSENTAQVFLGMRLQCAQCHNHPFDRWTMNDYYGFAAFFTQVARKPGEDPRETVIASSGAGEAAHPVNGQPVPPKFLGGETPDVKGKDRRAVLADWLGSSRNPYFARNLANMVWAHFLGQGIIEPVDDVRVSNPPSNPELLDALASKLTESHYDFRRLVRDICTSRAYQRSSQANPANESDTRNFAHGAAHRVRAEVLLDCVSAVTESPEKFPGLPTGSRAVQIADGGTTNFFLTAFGRATRETVCTCEVKMEPNLSQALHLLNGDTVQRKIATGGVIKKLREAKTPPEKIVEELYLRCFTRPPTPAEAAKVKALIDDAGPAQQAQALEDVFWALLNSDEFLFNH